MNRVTLECMNDVEKTTAAIEKLNIGFMNLNAAKRRFNQHAMRYNHGRARKVSFKRPSPQMSRQRLDELWTIEYLAEPIKWVQE